MTHISWSPLVAFLVLVSNSAFSQSAEEATPAVASAQAAPARICVAAPNAQMGQGTEAGDVAGPVRALLIDYLSGPVTEIVPLESNIDVQLRAEAQQFGCRFVVTSWVIHKKAGKGLKSLMAAGSVLSSALPMVGGGGDAYGTAMMAQSAMQGASMMGQNPYEAMSGVAESNIKKGDRITFEYIMTDAGTNAEVSRKLAELKAKADGEDILSPLIKDAASAIVTAALQ